MILNNKDCLGVQRVINSPKGDIDLYFQVNFNGQETIANLKDIVATFENVFVIDEDDKINLTVRQEDGTFMKFTELTNNITTFNYQPNLDQHIQLYEESLKTILDSNKVIKPEVQETPLSENIYKNDTSIQNDDLVTTFIQDTIVALSCTDAENFYKLSTEETTDHPEEPESELEKSDPIPEPNLQHNTIKWIDKLEINEVYNSPIYTEVKTIETENLIIEMSIGRLNIKTKR